MGCGVLLRPNFNGGNYGSSVASTCRLICQILYWATAIDDATNDAEHAVKMAQMRMRTLQAQTKSRSDKFLNMNAPPLAVDDSSSPVVVQSCEWDCSLRCIHCGYQARREGTRRNCTTTDRSPSIASQLTGYAAAVSRWLAAGAPRRSDDEVSRLLSICQACPTNRYDAARGACNRCGCKVNASGWGLVNKIRMATESCPDGHWSAGELSTKSGQLRVGFLTPNLIVGGVESWLISLVRELRHCDGIAVSGVGHIGGAGLWVRAITDELTALCPVVSECEIPGAARVPSITRAAQAVAAASDVLVVWSAWPDLLRACQGPRIVGVSHGCNDWWMRDCAAMVDQWVAVSEAAAVPCPVQIEAVEVIENGIDLERCRSSLSRAEARERLGLPITGRVVGYVGRFSAEKRIQQIAQAANWLPEDWSILFLGEGRDRPPESSRVFVRPATREIGDVWRACDVAVVASEAEGYCLSAVEAIAAGVPLASTPVGIVERMGGFVSRIRQPAHPSEIAQAVEVAYRLGPDATLARWARSDASAAAMARRWARMLTGMLARA